MHELHAFIDGELAGTFTRGRHGEVAFSYTNSYHGTPLSLSIPLTGSHSSDAPAAFLDNLLPDDVNVRQRWAREHSLDDVTPFSLLGAVGEDVAGAISLSPDAELPHRPIQLAVEATEDDIATRIASLHHEPTSWVDPRVRPRMSLAGQQGKFSLARVGDQWFWPTYENPSTHILKPPSPRHARIAHFEHASLELARASTVPATWSDLTHFYGQPAFVASRWDRVGGRRIHAEDLCQALGLPSSDKYAVSAPRIARLLDRHGQAPAFVRQLAFNAAIGNADAHGKNYSVVLAGQDVRLAPLYDAIPTQFWPAYDQNFAMRIGNARQVAALTEKNWRRFAETAGLNTDLVLTNARDVMRAVSEQIEENYARAGADQRQLAHLRKRAVTLRSLLPDPHG